MHIVFTHGGKKYWHTGSTLVMTVVCDVDEEDADVVNDVDVDVDVDVDDDVDVVDVLCNGRQW